MSQEIVEKKAQPLTDLTEMQKRFCEYLIFNEGRTTHQDAALHAGYSPKRAAVLLLSLDCIQHAMQRPGEWFYPH